MQDEHFVDPSIVSPQKFLFFGQLRFCHPARTMKRSASVPLSIGSAQMMKLQVKSERFSEDCPVAPATAVAATSAADQDMPDLQHGFEEMSVEDAGTGQPKDPVQPSTEDLETPAEPPSEPTLCRGGCGILATNECMGTSPQLHKALRDKQAWIGAYCCGDCALRHNDCPGWNNLPSQRPHGPRCTGFVVENGNEEDDTAATSNGWHVE